MQDEFIDATHPSSKCVDFESHIIATYYVESELPLSNLAESMALSQTTGSWTPLKHETVEMRKKYCGKIVDISNSHVKIAFPIDNLDPTRGGIPLLLTTTGGNLFDYTLFDNVKLLDLQLPKRYTSSFRGPKHGLEGVRRLLKVDHRPLLGTIVKPNLGLKSADVAEICYEAAYSGIDFIKDDDKNVNPKYCPIEDRVPKVMEKIDKANEEKGGKTLYAVNITSGLDNILEMADLAISCGANCLMVNVLSAGLSSLQALSEDPSINVPLHGHLDMIGLFARNPKNGIGVAVISRLARLAGADHLHVGSIGGRLFTEKEDVKRSADILRCGWNNIRPTLPVCAGGLHPGIFDLNYSLVGNDALYICGGGIHGHPEGISAGVKAMIQAIETCSQHIPFEQALQNFKEFRIAIEKWGKK